MPHLLYSFIIPVYNGEQFLEQSIHSLISSRLIEENIPKYYEIIIVDDGSTDKTLEHALILSQKWNKIVRKNFIKIISKENGQYGSAINSGLKIAQGEYFKVLDVDDTFNMSSLIKIVYMTLGFKKTVDVILTDHVFEKVGVDKRELQSLRKYFVPNKILDLQKQKMPKDLMTMHSFIYRTKFLKEINFKQIEGVYYSDSQYSLVPLLKAKTLYYAQLSLYRYYIGRDEQSISLKTMVKNRLHQMKVMKILWRQVDLEKIKSHSMKRYAIVVLKQMVEWQLMLIIFDKKNSNKKKVHQIMILLKELEKLKPKNSKKILKGFLFFLIRIFHGHGIPFVIVLAVKIYSKFKKNILAEWDY